MNKFAATMMLIEGMGARRFVVIERDDHEVRAALDVFAREIEERRIQATVFRASGAVRIDLPFGGRIDFVTPRSNRMRSMSADVVFIDNDAHRVLGESAHERFRDDIAAILAARDGEVVHS
ncbi:hypothetical protein [Microbacterium sp. MMO-10]|uniref:hypothetical protein n=1 Tax=Microbacterium sp. MMO-10 TaxID=3081272 RepID=UPI0030158FAE